MVTVPPPSASSAASSTADPALQAGASALEVAAQLELDVECVSRQLTGMVTALQELRRRQARFRAGAAGEQHAVRAVLDALHDGWSLLADRRWPGTRNANLDILLVGPGGVLVADVKRWRDVRVTADGLYRGQEPAGEQVEAVAAQARSVREVLVEAGLAPGEVVPVLVLDGVDLPPTTLGAVHLLGDRHLARYLVRRAARLDADQVAAVLAALDRACPPHARRRGSPATAAVPAVTPAGTDGGQPALLDSADVLRALVDAAATEPIEAWMTWLHPSQGRLVTRRWNGPARIRGAAGTGKTVVALHRARFLATHGRRVLFTSYVRTLSPVFRSLFARLAPDLDGRVEFASVHQVALRLLRAAGRPVRVDPAAVETCYARAWSAVRRDSPLATAGVPPSYWREEISHVIKGRAVTDVDAYARLRRPGRGAALGTSRRTAVWQLYQEYQQRLTEQGLADWDDVLILARTAVAEGAVTSPWDAVIVDEVQDLTAAGLRLLHALAGDRTDGLLLVGDGQQALYPGGVSLAETGISVVGRSAVLELNYRNSDAVLREALALVGADPFDDLSDDPAADDPAGVRPGGGAGRGDGLREDGGRRVQVVRRGGTVVRAEAADPTSQRLALLAHLAHLHQDGVRYGDVPLLAPTNAAAGRWARQLRDAGVPVTLLSDYTGVRDESVKVGTFERAKALEFAHVLIPDSDRLPGPRRPTESDDVYAERSARERNRLFVGCTRPRDGLWLGATAPPAPPLR